MRTLELEGKLTDAELEERATPTLMDINVLPALVGTSTVA
jgi:hypothetical protein